MYATVHNAKKVTLDGRDCWLACIFDPRVYKHVPVDTEECATKPEAVRWVTRQLQRRGFERPDVRVED